MSAADDEAARLKQELLSRLLAQRAGGGATAVRKVAASEEVAASFAQRRLWFLDELTAGQATYNVPFGFRLLGELSTEAVERAWREVFRRHEALRTEFARTAEGELMQRLRAPKELPVDLVDFSTSGVAEARRRARLRVAEFGGRPFDLAADPLVRVELIRISSTEHLLMLNIHHIVSDGWSEQIAFKEFAELYTGFAQGEQVRLPEVPFQYRDYTAWEYGVAARGGFERDLAYWADQLAGAPPLLELPHDKPYPRRVTSAGRTVAFPVEPEITAAVDRLKAACGTTTFAVALAAFAVLLHRVTGVGDVVLGVPVANRGRPEWDRTCGLFVNTVAVRIAVHGGQSPLEVVRATGDRLLAAQEHQHVPFDKVANRVAPGRDAAFTPVFQVMCNADDARHALRLPGITATPIEVESGTAKFDLSLHVREDGQGSLAGGSVEYRTDLFGATEAESLIGHYRTVLRAFAERPDRPVADLPLATSTEPENQHHRPDSPGGVRRVLDHATWSPEAPAVRDEGGVVLSYAALATRVKQTAGRLAAMPIGPGATVAITLDSPLDRLIWTMGTLLADGQVLLLDPDWPADLANGLGAPSVLVGDGTAGVPVLAAGDMAGPRHEAVGAFQVPALGADGKVGLLGFPKPDLPVLRALAAGESVDLRDVPRAWQSPGETGRCLLDEYLHPVAAGAVGEFYERGTAREWVGEPARTAADFVPDPAGPPGVRLRRTGTLGRLRVDGEIEVLGRRHRSVLIDGILTRPEATEAALQALPGVADAAVVPDADDRPSLVGFFVAPAGTDPAPLLAELTETLLRHQVPSRLIRLDALPRTPLGTVDHESLTTAAERDAEDIADSGAGWTTSERRMAQLWSELLRRTGLRREDDFFAAGGHSMLATRLIARIRREWDLEVPLRSVFDQPMLGPLAALVDRLAAGTATADHATAIPRRSEGTAIPLSPNQEHLWFLDQMSTEDGQYNLTLALELDGGLDTAALHAALAGVVHRHDSLRTRIERAGGTPMQVVVADAEVDHTLVDLTGRAKEALQVAESDAAEPFDLARGPLLRSRVYRLARDRHLFVLTVHHLVFDEWSGAVFQHELAEFYRAAVADVPAALPALPIQYPDYAVWQRAKQTKSTVDEQLTYWTGRLADAPAYLDLPTDRPRPAVRTAAAGLVRRLVPKDLLDRIGEVGAAEGCTLYMTLLSAFAVLMHRFSGQQDLLVGTTVTSRSRIELEGQIGYFVNTIAVPSRLTADTAFRDVLAGIRREMLDGHPHREVPFAKVVQRLAPDRSTGHPPLVQVVFDMQAETEQPAELTGLTTRPVRLGSAAVDFDLVLAARVTEPGLRLELEYSIDVFTADTAERLLGHFHTLLASIARQPEGKGSRLPIMTDAERAAVLAAASGRRRAAEPIALHEVFRRQAESTPDAIALTHRGVQVTYARLNADANALARRLIALGVGPDTCVGLLLDRGPRLFTAVLAVLKAGGAYVPLDLSYPVDRLRFMAAEAGIRLVLADADALGQATDVMGETGRVLAVPDGPISAESANEPHVTVLPDNLAYVLYTSGSTGRPKGVAMTHRALGNLMHWDREEIPVRPGGAVLQFNSLGFDASFVEIFATWQVGARLVVLPDDAARRDPAAVLAQLETGGVERWDVPYAGLVNVVNWTRGRDRTPLLRLRAIMCGGEQLQVTGDLISWFRALPGCRLINQYGPSEVNRATSHRLRAKPGGWPVLPPIGRPADNTAVHVLDPAGEPVPAGFPGEVWISGENLARGYVNRPALTAERFLPDTLGGEPGARLYRTGDLARYAADGELEYLGRIDTQVKLRGHRVELGEVEAALQRLPAVTGAAVAVHGSGVAKRLIGYLVFADAAAKPKPSAVAEALAETLPEYMVPSRFLVLDRLPLTASGKLDRRKLPPPEEAAESTEDYVAPVGEHELQVCAIWEELLGRDGIGATDNFFALGGHSLLATEFIARLHEENGVSARISTLFENPTVRRFCKAVAWAGPESNDSRVRKLPRRGRAGAKQG